MKNVIFAFALCLFCGNIKAQTVVTFKPGPALGENATLATTYGCTPTGYSTPWENVNFSSDPEILCMDWTFSSQGCSHGTSRSLIRFTQLNTLFGPNTTIYSATLKLYTPPSSGSYGNSYYPGSPFTLTNDGYVRRVTSSWAKNTVTWAGAPSTTTSNQAAIPVSTSRFNWTVSIDVTDMVSDMVALGQNDGFMLGLNTEAIYRSLLFASSNHSDSTLWPELIITYSVCDASFNYCFNSNNPFLVSLDAANTTTAFYDWYVNGIFAGNTSGINYAFPGPGSYLVCLNVVPEPYDHECNRCVTICVDSNQVFSKPARQEEPIAKKHVPQGSLPPLDQDILFPKSISPNPTHTDWNISFSAASDGNADVLLYDLEGRLLAKEERNITHGSNQILFPSDGFASGIYILEVKNSHFSIKEKVTKK